MKLPKSVAESATIARPSAGVFRTNFCFEKTLPISSTHSATVASIAPHDNPNGLSQLRPLTVTGPMRPKSIVLGSVVKSHDTCESCDFNLLFKAIHANCDINVDGTLLNLLFLPVAMELRVEKGIFLSIRVVCLFRGREGAVLDDATIESWRPPQVYNNVCIEAIIRHIVKNFFIILFLCLRFCCGGDFFLVSAFMLNEKSNVFMVLCTQY
mmetsp:Transcript_6440/g.7418  ORF Transcript_6440/g.7418 Transcript_6440/m.7418 type:complete len:211 (+) Transcript_6440:488-1120(+)